MAEVLPVAPFKKMLKKTNHRVSEDAAGALAEVIEELGFLVVEEALSIAESKKRKTIRKEDIDNARRALW
ncbi:MAG: histone [Candidatus Altiarchaeota archaeon]|nr:histone [Candidatus Altiarchaeota archaeon]